MGFTINNEKDLRKLEESVGEFSMYQCTIGDQPFHGQNVPFLQKPAQQLLTALNCKSDDAARDAFLSSTQDGQPLLAPESGTIDILPFGQTDGSMKLSFEAERIKRLLNSAKIYVNTSIVPPGLYPYTQRNNLIDGQDQSIVGDKIEAAPDTDKGLFWQNIAVGVCHAQEIDLLVSHKMINGKAYAAPRSGKVTKDLPAILLLSSPALNFSYGVAGLLTAEEVNNYLEGMFRNLFAATLSEGRQYIAMPAAGLGVFGGDPEVYFNVLFKVAKEFPDLNIIYHPGHPKNWKVFQAIQAAHTDVTNVWRAEKDVVFIADALTKEGYPCALQNPSDCDAVYGVRDIGQYWKDGTGSGYVGEEHLGAMTTAPLNSKGLNPAVYNERIIQAQFRSSADMQIEQRATTAAAAAAAHVNPSLLAAERRARETVSSISPPALSNDSPLTPGVTFRTEESAQAADARAKAAEARARAEAEAKAKTIAEEEARVRAEIEAKAVEARARAEEEAKLVLEAEAQAAKVRAIAEAQERNAAVEIARAGMNEDPEAAKARALAEAEAKSAVEKAEAQVLEARAKAQAEARAAAQAEAKAAEARAKAEAEAEAKAAEARAKAEAEAKAAEARAKAEAEAKAAEARAKAEAEAKAAEARAKAEAEVKAAEARAIAEAEAKAAEARAKAEAEAKADREAAAKRKAAREAEAAEALLADRKKVRIADFNNHLKTLKVTTDRLSTNTSKSYKTVKAAAEKLYKDLEAVRNDFSALLSTMTSADFKAKCVGIVRAAENDFKQHRGIWFKDFHPTVRKILGVLATITILPALIVAVASKPGYKNTFFATPATKSQKALDNFSDELANIDKPRLGA